MTTTPPRIAQLANFIGPTSGGMKVAVEQLGRGYVRSGCVRLLVIPGAEHRVTHTEQGTIVEVKAPQFVGGYRMILDARPVIAALESFAPTSIELSDKWSLMPVTNWARRRDIRTVLFSHERLDIMLPQRLKVQRGLVTPIALYNTYLRRSVDALVVTSEFAAAEFRRRRIATETPIHRVPLGVDLATFRPMERTPHNGTMRLIHFGRLSREKDPHLAVATALELMRRGLDVHLDVVGDGPHRWELEQMAAGANVTFHGHVPGRRELASLVAAADASLSVSPGETFGLAVLEALACGTPVVTANLGGARELVDDSCGAWGHPTPSSLADATVRLFGTHEPTRRECARRRAEGYPWSSVIDSMLAIHQHEAWLPLSRSA